MPPTVPRPMSIRARLARSTTRRLPGARLGTLLLVAGLAGGLLPLAAPAPPVRARSTFTVTTTGDGGDTDGTPDGKCDSNPTRLVDCTLREAIQEANAAPGRDEIRFAIDEAVDPPVKTIRPMSWLPEITDPVMIDGYTQPGARPNGRAAGTNATLLVELDGSGITGYAVGLLIRAANTVVRGLVVNRFDDGIVVSERGRGGSITGCFVGTDAAGTGARPNGLGLVIYGRDAVVGGGDRAARNLIAGNDRGGLFFDQNAAGGRARGNLIGTDRTGAAPLANGGSGVVSSAPNVVVGGDAAAANVIAFNGGAGVEVVSTVLLPAVGNQVLRNRIVANGGPGIDLNGDGPSANDPVGDGDGGANGTQNYPRLDKATTVGTVTTVTGRLTSIPRQDFVLRFFANPGGGDEGEVFLGQQRVDTNGAGNAAFRFVPERRVPIGQTVTATTTDAGGNTSEFSPPRTVESGTING